MYPTERDYRLGLYSGSENAGVVLGPVLGGVVLTLTATNFTFAFIVSGVIGVLALATMHWVPRDRFTAAPSAPSLSADERRLGQTLRTLAAVVREIAADSQIRLVSLVEAMLWMGIGSLQAYLPVYALSVQIPVWQIRVLAGGQGVASTVSRPYLGKRSDRIGRKPLLVGGTLLCVATLIAVPNTASSW